MESVDAICDSAMREFGMPERIRTDTGVPFASSGLLGLSRLGLKWIRLGIAMNVLIQVLRRKTGAMNVCTAH